MASTQVKEFVNIYKLLAEYPTLTSARIIDAHSNLLNIQAIWTQKDLERKIDRYFLTNYTLNSTLTVLLNALAIDITEELMSTVTKNGELRAALRQVTIDNTKKQFIEICDKQHFVKNYDLSALDVHGDVYIDAEFGSFDWSPDNTKILYIAEKKLPKAEPFYKQKPLHNKNKDTEEDVKVGDEYIYKPHWGEQLVGKHRPVIVVLDTVADTVTVLPGIPDELSPGEVIWTKDQAIVGVAFKHEPRHLGLVACTNRYSWVFILKDGKYQTLSDEGCAVHSPRISPDGNYLVWLQREAGCVPHHNAHKLVLRDLRTENNHINEIVEIVEVSKTINNNRQFYGIYGCLPRRCWSDDSQYLLFSTSQKHNVVSYIVNIKTKDITEIKNDGSSLRILDVNKDIILFLCTSLMQPSSLMAGHFISKAANTGDIPKSIITIPKKIDSFKEIMYEPNDYTYSNNDSIKQFNFIYFGPKGGIDKSIPLIIIPHGGPHSNFTNVFSLEHAFFVLTGHAVVQVNYRGSTGMGSMNVEYLQGKVGDADVRDCITATKEAIKKYPWLDEKHIGLCGGSHGGFLVAHLSGQAPDMYKAVVARNPVIDISVMFDTSDIPDCRNALTKEEKIVYLRKVCAVEAGFPYNVSANMSEIDMFVKMKKCSPIMHVDKVKAPTLLCIGTEDLRVPSSQGMMWYHRLKANKVKTKMLVYKDNHSLSTGPVHIDHIINDCLWLHEHLSIPEEPPTSNSEE